MIITQHVTWKRSDWNVRNQEPSPRKWSIYTRPFSSREGGVWERDYIAPCVPCGLSIYVCLNQLIKTDAVPCVQAASPFFTTPCQSLIVPQDISYTENIRMLV